MRIKLKIQQDVTGELSDEEFGRALISIVSDRLEIEDDAGLDWITDGAGNTFIGDPDWEVSQDPLIAALVDAANILIRERPTKIDDPDLEWLPVR